MIMVGCGGCGGDGSSNRCEVVYLYFFSFHSSLSYIRETQ